MKDIHATDYHRNPSKGRDRTAYVRLQVIPLVRMPKSELVNKVRLSCERGRIDPDIDVAYIQYDHLYNGKQKGWRTISEADKLKALADFYAIVTSADDIDVDEPEE